MKTAVCLVLLVVAAGDFARASEPTTGEERAKLVRVIRDLEKTPFQAGASVDRAWALQLIENASDITVKINANLLKEVLESEAPDRSVVVAHFILGQAALVVEKADLAKSDEACAEAAFAGALRVYRKAVDRNAENRIEFLDKLDKSELQGTLKREVDRLVALRRPKRTQNDVRPRRP
jgi:hypothetical protein